jgi:fructose-bisphosphate aldolase class I
MNSQLLGGYQTIPERNAPKSSLAIVAAVAVCALTAGAAAGFASSSTSLYAPTASAIRPAVQASTVQRVAATPTNVVYSNVAQGAPSQTYENTSSSTFATSSIAAFVGMMAGAGALVLARMTQSKPVAMAAWTGHVYGVPLSTVDKPWTKHADELRATAKKICQPGKGILAADESNKTCGARFKSIGVENTEENRRAYRELLLTAPGFKDSISGVIMYEETLYQKDANGKSFVDIINEAGAVSGIKVDTGIAALPGADDEGYTMGLDGLRERCHEYYRQGARFAKWRAVLRIDSKGLPSDRSIMANATGLAQYAAICQECGLVPIVEPEILMDGDHDIETAAAVAERVLVAVYGALATCGVLLEGTLLKPNMVTPGVDSGIKATPEDIAYYTVRTFSRTVPPAVAGITFLSGGMSEEEASLNLNAINAIPMERKPWTLTFSFGRALQATTLKTWGGKVENKAAAQAVLAERAKANGMAQLGKYVGTGKAGESLFVKGYKY